MKYKILIKLTVNLKSLCVKVKLNVLNIFLIPDKVAFIGYFSDVL